ncbi:flagellar hook-associated protein FlgK [Pseudomonas aeruginosa]|nr:flagellar hook-associated protein FlgK [Pseudomonas aeruginosa]
MAFTDPSGQKYSYEFELSGVPQNSDSFKLGFNDKGISDNRNALNLLALADQADRRRHRQHRFHL